MSSNTASAGKPTQSNAFGQVGTFVWRSILFWGGLIVFLAAGYFLSVAFEWLGIFFQWWQQPGAGHSASMFTIEYNYINRDLANGLFRGGTLNVVEGAIDWADEVVTPAPGGWVSQIMAVLHRPVLSTDWNVVSWAKNTAADSSEYLLAARNIALVYILRLTIIVLSLPLFILILHTSTIDGLAQRERRKAGGGIESGFIYHHMKKWRGITLLLPLIVYLSSPFPTHPNLALLPIAAVLWMTNYIFVLKFKKNL